ncbi:hypothetical protein DEJ25_11165 [Curtobacterium sp. MCPF17_011]|nr:hypothetical protein DEJ31_04450 [Curtobacterium sp. MCPF17_031]PZF10947.1 hypothetical protein DEJ25_11165 [Curtobacterium sp. MCPF17_011]
MPNYFPESMVEWYTQHHGRTGQMHSTPASNSFVDGDTPTEAIDMTALFAEQSRDGLLDSI